MVRYYMIVSGRVQGVGFRYFVLMEATKLGLTGFVRNCDNGYVEIEAQGEEGQLMKFNSRLNRGNGFSRVENISIRSISIVDNEKKFNMKY